MAVGVLNLPAPVLAGHQPGPLLGPGDPAGAVEGEGLQAHGDAVLPLQAVGEDLELEAPHGTHDGDGAGDGVGVEEKDGPLLRQVVESLVELLAAHGVAAHAHGGEVLRREAGDAGVLHPRLGAQGVAHPQAPPVVDAHHVAGHRVVHRRALPGHELLGRGQAHRAPGARHIGVHPRLVASGADPHEGDAVPVLRIHVRLHLEDEAGEGAVHRIHHFAAALPGGRGRGQLQEVAEEHFHARVGEGAAEEDGGEAPLRDCRPVPGRSHLVQEVQVLPELGGAGVAQELFHPGVIQGEHGGVQTGLAVVRLTGEDVELPAEAVESRHHAPVPARRPGGGVAPDVQVPGDVVQELEGVGPLPVALVHEGHDGEAPPLADDEELAGLLLHPPAVVQEHDGAVRRREGPVGVLGEVLVPRGVQEVHPKTFPVEVEGRGGDGDPPLLLHGHPVRGGVARRAAPLHRPGQVQGPSVEKELLREGGLPRVRVTDDGEGAPPADLEGEIRAGRWPGGRAGGGGWRWGGGRGLHRPRCPGRVEVSRGGGPRGPMEIDQASLMNQPTLIYYGYAYDYLVRDHGPRGLGARR